MNISFVLPNSEKSGCLRSTVRLANGLIDRGHRIRLLIYNEKFSTRKIKPFIRRTWFDICYPDAENWISSFRGEIEKFRDINHCSFQRGEIVIATGIWCCREIKKLNTRDVRKVHNIRGQIPWEKDLMREAFAEDVPKIVVAGYLKETVREICGREITAVIPNGIDTAQYFPSVPENQRNGIGTIFHQSKHKDPETHIKILDRLHKDCPEIPQRVFGVSRKPQEIDRDAYTRFPTVEKAREIYSRSLVWIMASRSEGFPNPVLEAMACGCAVIATDCGGPRDMITDGENGFLVTIGNVDEITDKTKQLLNDDTLRRKMVDKAQQTVRKFTWENSIGKWEEVLSKLSIQETVTIDS